MGASKPTRLPNFLVVGAAKCGTTAIANYLSQHPDIYFCPLKEPKFISSQFMRFPLAGPGDEFIESFTVKSFQEYIRLFSRVKDERAIGEGSVENLYYHRQAIPLIKERFGSPKIIIVLRDPTRRAFSAYKQLLRDHREKAGFEQGLALEQSRKQANWEFLWYYRSLGYYFAQVQAYLRSFPEVRVALFDDFVDSPLSFIKDLYAFLDVDDSFEPRLSERLNRSGIVRAGFWDMLFRGRRRMVGALYKYLALHGLYDSRILYLIERVRHRNMQQIEMAPETEHRLRQDFSEDVRRTQELTGRDLSSWLGNAAASDSPDNAPGAALTTTDSPRTKSSQTSAVGAGALQQEYP